MGRKAPAVRAIPGSLVKMHPCIFTCLPPHPHHHLRSHRRKDRTRGMRGSSTHDGRPCDPADRMPLTYTHSIRVKVWPHLDRKAQTLCEMSGLRRREARSGSQRGWEARENAWTHFHEAARDGSYGRCLPAPLRAGPRLDALFFYPKHRHPHGRASPLSAPPPRSPQPRTALSGRRR